MRISTLYILTIIIIFGLVIIGCGGPPDDGHVGPVGPVGPQGDIGPQGIHSTTPANLTVIEDTDIMVTKDYSFSGFTRLVIYDGFDVRISQGSDYVVRAQFEETAVPYIQVSQQDDTLVIRLEPERTYNMVNITLDVEIAMPQLTEITLRDGADATVIGLAGFESEVDFLSNLNIE